MSTVSATVTAGKTWTPDVDGKILLDADALNLTANPAVAVPLANRIAAEDLQASSVTTDKLAALAVSLAKLAADASFYLRKVLLTPRDDTDGTGAITIQVQDANGNNLTGRFMVRTWISSTIYGAPTAQTTFAATGELAVHTILSNGHIVILTDGNGAITLDVNASSGTAATRYVMVEIGGQVFYERLVLTAP